MIPENIKTRIYPSGKLRKQLFIIKQIDNDHPDSQYAKTVLKQFKQKFWLGSNQVNYYGIFTKAWNKLFPGPLSEIIEIGGLKFINDDAFKTEFTDIFIAGGMDISTQDQEKIIASEVLSLLSAEGPYENEEVILAKEDIVIDAGANLGLFSLFCTQKKVKKVYAFEPQKGVLDLLKKNVSLNNVSEIIKVVPLGLSDKNGDYSLSHSETSHAAGSIVMQRNNENDTEIVHCVKLDDWVKENNIPKIDFIKADIEGAERNMLLGAIEVLKKFSPRLAICTYHLPDDPKVLKNIILQANPDYVIRQSSHKLFAFIPH